MSPREGPRSPGLRRGSAHASPWCVSRHQGGRQASRVAVGGQPPAVAPCAAAPCRCGGAPRKAAHQRSCTLPCPQYEDEHQSCSILLARWAARARRWGAVGCTTRPGRARVHTLLHAGLESPRGAQSACPGGPLVPRRPAPRGPSHLTQVLQARCPALARAAARASAPRTMRPPTTHAHTQDPQPRRRAAHAAAPRPVPLAAPLLPASRPHCGAAPGALPAAALRAGRAGGAASRGAAPPDRRAAAPPPPRLLPPHRLHTRPCARRCTSCTAALTAS